MNDYRDPTHGRPTGPASEDERLRWLLNDAVSDVEPRDTLDAIQSRTKVTPLRSRRPWVLGAAAAAVATAATVTAVAVTGNTGGTPQAENPGFAGSPSVTATSPAGETPTGEPTQDATATATPAQTVTVPVYYLGETSRGVRLFREFQSVEAVGGDRAGAAAAQALRAPADPDYRTVWPENTEVAQVSYDGDFVTVDLASPAGPESLRNRPADITEEEAQLSVEQLIYTVQGALQEGRPGVQFLIDGQRTDAVLGVPASEPLAQGESIDVLAQVWIIEPGEGAEVSSPFEVSGLAAAFEANVVWELRDGDRVVREGFTTAEQCCTMAPYSFTVNAPPGTYTLVVSDTDPSGGEGFAPWEDTKTITVR